MPLSYTSVARIRMMYPLIASLTNVSSQQVALFAGDAEAHVNGVIARSYTVPATGAGVPPLLETIATDLAVYRILRRLFSQEKLKDSDWPGTFKAAEDQLDEIGSGKLLLLDASNAIITGRTDVAEVWSTTKDYDRTFTELHEFDQIVDQDKVDDLAADRGISGRYLT